LGGAEKLLVGALPHVDRKTFDYEVGYLLPWKDALVPSIQAEGIPVTCYGLDGLHRLNAYWNLWRHVRRGRFDVIHAHLPLASFLARCCRRLRRPPVIIYTAHGLWARQHPLTRFVNRGTIRLNHQTIAVSDQVARSLPSLPTRSVTTIDNGIDVSAMSAWSDQRDAVRQELGIPAATTVIGNVANLSPIKRHDLLIEAFSAVHARQPHTRLLLIGQYRDRLEELENHARRLGVEHAVQFTGPRDDVPRLLSAMDIFCLSSDSEGLPVSLLEAMSAKLPVVATQVGGIPGVIDSPELGLLVPPDNPDQLQAAVEMLVTDPSLRRQLGQAGHDRVLARYDISRMVGRVEELYRNLLEVSPGESDR